MEMVIGIKENKHLVLKLADIKLEKIGCIGKYDYPLFDIMCGCSISGI